VGSEMTARMESGADEMLVEGCRDAAFEWYEVAPMRAGCWSAWEDAYEEKEVDLDAAFRCGWCDKVVLQRDAERCLDDRVCRGRCWDLYCNAPIKIVGGDWWDVEWQS